MWILTLFMYINIFVLEVVRKIKISKEESQIPDTYSSSMGFTKSLILLYTLSLISFGISIWLLLTLGFPLNQIVLIELALIVIVSLSIWLHGIKKTKRTEGLLLLAILLQYVGLNSIICILQVW